MNTSPKNHQTTIRFSDELWSQLERAAADLDVSVAQYIREAARARLAQQESSRRPEHIEAEAAVQRSLDEAEGSAALWEQGHLARERARVLRQAAQKRRADSARY